MMRRNVVLLAMAVVSLALLADVTAAEQETAEILLPSQGGLEAVGGKPPCCDTCKCTRSMPPICQCMDKKNYKCHESCQKCVELPIKIWPPKFVCEDTFQGYCGSPCTKE